MSKIRGLAMSELLPTEAAYIAGLLDGEGTITVSRKKDRTGIRGGFAYRPYVAVANTNIAMLDWCKRTTGIGLVRKGSTAIAGRKQGFKWEVWSQKAGQVLRAARPYLVIKKAQADLLLEMIDNKRDGVGRDGLSDAEWSLQIRTWEQLKALNKRGA